MPAVHTDIRVYDLQEINQVPDPVPDTGTPPPSGDTIYFTPTPITGSGTSGEQGVIYTSSIPVSTLVSLPPLISPAPIPTPENNPLPPTTSTLAPSHKISRTAIIALCVVGGVALLIIFIAIMISRRPRRRKCPTPSLPILQDAAFPAQFDGQGSESPIFGGKERFSPSLRDPRGNTGLWTWTQYHSGLPKLAPAVAVTIPTSGRSSNQENTLAEKGTLFAGQDQHRVASHGKPRQMFQRPAQDATNHAISRLSTISYPNSLGSNTDCGAVNVGIAIDDTAPLRGDGQAIKFANDCGGRNSLVAPPSAKDSSLLGSYQSLAYGGMQVITSALTESGRRPPNGGRVRITSTYYMSGSHPRTSGPNGRGQQDGLHLDGLQRSGSGRGREKQALSSPPGLASSIPTSSQEDSIGEAANAMTGIRSQKKPVPMTVDSAASRPVRSAVNIHSTGEPQRQARSSPTNQGTTCVKRVDDRPPRVPSPPPLPTLVEMTLAQDYHSPTYSIYGLYSGERKT